MSEIRFDGRVAIVTGAGGGLGRSHALLLASRGAKVVVNDLGVALDGSGNSGKAADSVVAEIQTAGGEAVASYDGVDTLDGAEKIVGVAKEAFGKVDILINNAGILRDVSFHKMTVDQWDAVLRVHLTGSMNVTKAAWPSLREQQYGRVVCTSSAAGLFGNFGQANYAAAKMGLVGFTRTLAQEGAKYGIKANVIAPLARSRMTESAFPAEMLATLEPSKVSPVVAYLSSEACEDSGQVYSVGGGYVGKVQVVEAKGARFEGELSIEDVAARWSDIGDLSDARVFTSALESVQAALGK